MRHGRKPSVQPPAFVSRGCRGVNFKRSTMVWLLCGFLSVSAFGCAGNPGPTIFQPVQSRSLNGNDPLARFHVTVHVLLQVHEHPLEEIRALQDQSRVTACQQNLVSTVAAIAAHGVNAVVMEGLYGVGTLEKPEPIVPADLSPSEQAEARWILPQRSDLSVYGFEIKPLNDFGYAVVSQLGNAITRLREEEKASASAKSPQDQERADKLIQEEVTRLNLWYAGVIPERSFLALQTALAVALARGENQVQLVIGRQHWGDLVYAVNRNRDVRVRLIPYLCE